MRSPFDRPMLAMGAEEAGEDQGYRDIIDGLVHDCRSGQGQIGPERARTGVWREGASSDMEPEDRETNALLVRLTDSERASLVRLLRSEFVNGVHTALVALYDAGVVPFDKAYEGTPFHDFMGRLMTDWEWPESSPRT